MRPRALIAAIAAALAVLVLALPDRSGGAADSVLVVGDSLGVGTEPYLTQAMPGTAIETDAEVGRATPEGLEVLADRLRPEHDVVVFALGSNDGLGAGSQVVANFERALALAGGRCLVVSTVALPKTGGLTDAALNQAIRGFASSHPEVRLVEWKRAVAADPSLLRDGVHGTPEGYVVRAGLIADAIASCDSPRAGDGIPNPSRDGRKGRKRPRPKRREPERRADPKPPEPEPLSRREAWQILADSVASQIAIGQLGGKG